MARPIHNADENADGGGSVLSSGVGAGLGDHAQQAHADDPEHSNLKPG